MESSTQYDQYHIPVGTPKASQTPAGQAPVPVADEGLKGADDAQKPIHDPEEFFKNAGVSEAPIPPGQRLVKREERIEYRDQDGNILNEEQVKALEGKVEFKTKYETRTRMLDPDGYEKEVAGGAEDLARVGVAPPHPDVEGVDSQTVNKGHGDGSAPPAKESVEGVHEDKAKKPKPASEKNAEASQP